MIVTTTINSENSLLDFHQFIQKEKLLRPHLIAEVLIGVSELSRYGNFKKDDLRPILKLAKNLGLKPVLVWDILQTEDRMEKNIDLFRSLPVEEFEQIRLQDPGVLEFIKREYSWLKIDLILETGNHNTLGIETWVDYVGAQLNRIVLSLEIPKIKLKEIIQKIKSKNPKLQIELLVYGPILLFYTPRPLLKALGPIKDSDILSLIDSDITLYATGKSEESPHSGFPLIENRHGTFMFNTKDHSLLTEFDELFELNIDVFRFDLEILNSNRENMFAQTFSHVDSVFAVKERDEQMEEIKKIAPRPLIKGFFQTNKTDVIFTKLKNRTIERQDKNYVGEIIDVERDVNLCLWVKAKNEITLPQKIKLISPESKVKELMLKSLTNLAGEVCETLIPGEYYLVPYLNSITLKSKVYLDCEEFLGE